MTRKTNAKARPNPAAEEAMAELFGSSDDSDRVDFGDIDWLACGRLVALCTQRGALVTFYVASADNTLCISIGVGERRKRYQTDTAEQFDQLIEGVFRKLGGSLAILK